MPLACSGWAALPTDTHPTQCLSCTGSSPISLNGRSGFLIARCIQNDSVLGPSARSRRWRARARKLGRGTLASTNDLRGWNQTLTSGFHCIREVAMTKLLLLSMLVFLTGCGDPVEECVAKKQDSWRKSNPNADYAKSTTANEQFRKQCASAGK